jgi:flagellar biosynthesis/type III secretory pathway M-ring protein FliF/YscJ
VTAHSDFKNYTFSVNLVNKHDDDDDDDDHHHDDHSKTDEVLFIVVVIIAAVIIIAFGAYIFAVVRKRTRHAAEERVSLLTDTQSFMDDRIPAS